MGSEVHKRVLDPEHDAAALKALTHPLRIRLLGLLRQDGPATASELAIRTGEPSASTARCTRRWTGVSPGCVVRMLLNS
ncbi:hypothetical protein AB0K48_59350, partial [Nonomuraea sp. NPDC055795]